MPNVMVALPNIGGALCSKPQSLATSSTAFTQCAAKAIEFDKITQNNGHYAVQGQFKITDFGTNRKLIYDGIMAVILRYFIEFDSFRGALRKSG